MKLSRFDACKDWKVVRWCRTQASSHNSQGVVDGGVNEALLMVGSNTLQSNEPGLGRLFATLLLQRPNRSQQAASGVRHVMLASCEVTQGVGGT